MCCSSYKNRTTQSWLQKKGGGGGGAGGKGDQGKADVSFEYYNGLSMFRNKKYYFLSLATSWLKFVQKRFYFILVYLLTSIAPPWTNLMPKEWQVAEENLFSLWQIPLHFKA